MTDKNSKMDRRSFLGALGGMSVAGATLASFPWLQSCTPQAQKEVTGEKTRIGVIGPGSRGMFHCMNLKNYVPEAEIVALCDNYPVNLENASKEFPNAKTYTDYRALLDDPNVDSVIIATPLYLHYEMAMAAIQAGKNVFCEKAMAYNIEECNRIYKAAVASGKVFIVGQQRLFDPKYLKAMEGVRNGDYGPVVNIRNYWFRNGDWRRPADPEWERHINWRLYREYSRGLMTELACHQIQNGSWAMGMHPTQVMGSGSLIYWKDGREVFDNVAVIYTYPNGVNMTFESVISNKHLGMGESILCKEATIDLPGSKIYYEKPAPRSGIEQMIGKIEKDLFSNAAFAGTSFTAESASKYPGISIMPEAHGDGSVEIMQAFCRASITGKQPPKVLEEAYYGSVFCLLGDEAMLRGEILTLPDEYKI